MRGRIEHAGMSLPIKLVNVTVVAALLLPSSAASDPEQSAGIAPAGYYLDEAGDIAPANG